MKLAMAMVIVCANRHLCMDQLQRIACAFHILQLLMVAVYVMLDLLQMPREIAFVLMERY
jgi:hypothetical protein